MKVVSTSKNIMLESLLNKKNNLNQIYKLEHFTK
jgi:hypothetical protein